MKSVYRDIFENVVRGNSHKFILEDGSTISFDKLGEDHYKMVLAHKGGKIKDTRHLKERGVQFMFQKFSDRSKYVNVHKGD